MGDGKKSRALKPPTIIGCCLMSNPKVRETRDSLGLTQAEAASRALVSLRAWIKYESGERAIPAPTWALFRLRTGLVTLRDLERESAIV